MRQDVTDAGFAFQSAREMPSTSMAARLTLMRMPAWSVALA